MSKSRPHDVAAADHAAQLRQETAVLFTETAPGGSPGADQDEVEQELAAAG